MNIDLPSLHIDHLEFRVLYGLHTNEPIPDVISLALALNKRR